MIIWPLFFVNNLNKTFKYFIGYDEKIKFKINLKIQLNYIIDIFNSNQYDNDQMCQRGIVEIVDKL